MNIFLITSCLIPPNSTIDNGPRNVYTSDERLNQTLVTIESIKKRVPNSHCIIIELSFLNTEQKKIMENISDNFIDLSSNRTAQYYMDHNKSIGDLFSTLQGLLYVFEKNMEYKSIFKISGRYYLNDDFDISNFTVNNIVFNKSIISFPHYELKFFYTVLYSFGYDMRFVFLKTLLDSIFFLDHKCSQNIEHAMLLVLEKNNNVKIVEKIGASGNISVNGHFISI
jgi:hypothetical protein